MSNRDYTVKFDRNGNSLSKPVENVENYSENRRPLNFDNKDYSRINKYEKIITHKQKPVRSRSV